MSQAAEMLTQGIVDRLFVPPLHDVGWFKHHQNAELRHAPKITTNDRHIDWANWTANKILRRHTVIGPLWNITKGSSAGRTHTKRIIWTNGFRKVQWDKETVPPPGHAVLKFPDSDNQQQQSLIVRTCDGCILEVDEAKIEGGRVEQVTAASRRAGMIQDDLSQSSSWFKSRFE